MIEPLVACLDRTAAYIQALVEDLTDEEMTLQPPGVPNHGAWTLGHVIFSCQAIAGELGVPPWLPDDWESLFGYGSSPAAVAGSAHSPKPALLRSFEDATARLRAALLGVAQTRLLDPLPDVDARQIFSTTGEALLQIVSAHTAFHAGQLAAWRRAIGRKPAGTFI